MKKIFYSVSIVLSILLVYLIQSYYQAKRDIKDYYKRGTIDKSQFKIEFYSWSFSKKQILYLFFVMKRRDTIRGINNWGLYCRSIDILIDKSMYPTATYHNEFIKTHNESINKTYLNDQNIELDSAHHSKSNTFSSDFDSWEVETQSPIDEDTRDMLFD